jgi:SAM-dependent methyltransferase
VFALDWAQEEVVGTRNTFGAMIEAREIPDVTYGGALRGDATRLPFADGTFDVVVTSEVLEHIQDDVTAISELHRVLKPGGTLGVTVPTWWPEKINWMLSDEYHAPKSPGGHVRIYSATELKAKLRSAGLDVFASHHAHALHSPYWWLKCAVGPANNDHPMVSRYRRFLEWDIMTAPRSTRLAERVLSPVLGKSLIVYSRKAA